MYQHQMRRLRAARERGMTLREIMSVIAILGLLASVIVVAVMNQLENAKVNTTKLKLKNIESALHQYKVQVEDYPSQSEGLRALLNPPGGLKPFLKGKGVPKDDFGNEVLYYRPARNGAGEFEVVSKGADGQEGTEDDLRPK